MQTHVKVLGVLFLISAGFLAFLAAAIPLGLEILWRSNGDPGSHVQPEVTVIERGGQTVAKGRDPYHRDDVLGWLLVK